MQADEPTPFVRCPDCDGLLSREHVERDGRGECLCCGKRGPFEPYHPPKRRPPEAP